MAQNYANRKYWETCQKGERNGELKPLERNGMPKTFRFVKEAWRNHGRPVQFNRLMMQRRKPEPIVLFWT